MSPPGGQPEESMEQRIRPAPRSIRPAPLPEEIREIVPLPPPPPVVAGEPSPLFRPDRSRMDRRSLERSTLRSSSRPPQGEAQTKPRRKLSLHFSPVFRIAAVLLLVAGLAAGGIWVMWQRLGLSTGRPAAPAGKVHSAAASGDRVLDMLEAFLTADGVPAKAAHVLDPERVRPLMERAYQKGSLPEASLRFGVPQPLEPGVWAVPAKVLGPPEFLLHLMVREVQGEPRLDWETYEQEISQRFPAFAASTSQEGGEFRLVLERAHAFAPGPDESLAVRVAAPGSPALAEPVMVRSDLAPAVADALPWNRRRRALVRLEWNTLPGSSAPRLLLTELVKWEFLP